MNMPPSSGGTQNLGMSHKIQTSGIDDDDWDLDDAQNNQQKSAQAAYVNTMGVQAQASKVQVGKVKSGGLDDDFDQLLEECGAGDVIPDQHNTF